MFCKKCALVDFYCRHTESKRFVQVSTVTCNITIGKKSKTVYWQLDWGFDNCQFERFPMLSNLIAVNLCDQHVKGLYEIGGNHSIWKEVKLECIQF